MDKTLREKIGADIKPYKILGVCSPEHAHAALQAEPNIGVFLPCKVVIKQLDENQVEVVAVNPMLMMQMLKNPELNEVAREVTTGLQKAIGSL